MERIRADRSFLSVFFSMVIALLLAACGGGGGGDSTGDPGPSASTTTISGKVTLSSTVTAKPALQKAMLSAPRGKPGSKAYKASRKTTSNELSSALFAPVLNASAFSSGTVYLYDADHPEWLAPVASAQTDSTGAYSLTKLENAATNGNAYTDGDSIPAGKYTLLAYKAGGWDPIRGVTTSDLVAVQTVVNSFDGNVTGNDLIAQESTAKPTVSAMFGVKQNTDGTQTWGSSATSLPANAAIQVSFSAAMSRGTLTSGITISPAVSGKWSLSADWTTATFYPDTGVTLAAGTAYLITVKGADTDATNAVKNVYGNALAKTAKGYFTAAAVDQVAPTAEWESPTLVEMNSPVDVTKPIRIRSNKQLDVNGLTLDGTINGASSLGAKPGVLYVGQNTAGMYVYEFVLGTPLQLGAAYTLTVSGGKGLNGLDMNALSGSLETTSAADTAGVDAAADPATQDAQAAVKDLLGKWIRGYSDRNITQVQSMVSPDFYFEDANPDPKGDVNKDGRLSLSEFSNMLVTDAFPGWEFCGTTITGEIVGTINVVGDAADFAFNMIGSSTNASTQCQESVPRQTFYANVQKLNGAWTIVRTSLGIDTRASAITYPNLIGGLTLSQKDIVTGVISDIPDGGTTELNFDPVSATETKPITYSWQAATGVNTYVLVRMDANNPENLRACALPGTATSWVTSNGCGTAGGVNVSDKFGLNQNIAMGALHVAGGQYHWVVVGLGTATTASIANMAPKDILKDVSAVSTVKSYTMAGTFQEITAQVYGVTNGTAATTASTYSVITGGYDVGAAGQAKIVVTTTNLAATSGYVSISGNIWNWYPVTFDATGTATITVDLSRGTNWIEVSDCDDWSQCAAPLYKGFSITTTGGIPPVVEITSMSVGGTAIAGDQWHYYSAPTGATQVTVSGTVTNPSITALDLNVGNSTSNAWTSVSVPVTNGTFSQTVDIYYGDNWINAGGGYYDANQNWMWSGDYATVYTDTGTVYVPSISVTSVTTASLTGDWGNSSDWDASSDSDNIVTITGKFNQTVADGTYSISSDGGWSNGTLAVATDGIFSLDVTVYAGWNYIWINDATGNGYGVNIYTAAGKTVVKPTITGVDGVAPTTDLYGQNVAASTGCTATVTGTAKAGDLYVYWNGFDGLNYYNENQTLKLTGAADTAIAFSISVPLVGGTGSYNNVDVYDSNWRWTGVKVTTSAACTYAAPSATLTAMLDSAGTEIFYDAVNGVYPAASSQTVTLTGTANRPGVTVTASVYACSNESYTATADGAGNWTIPNVKVYDGWNNLSLSDGYNWLNYAVTTANGATPVAVMSTAVSPATPTFPSPCGGGEWDAGTATSVTITGTTTAPDGTGTYYDALNTSRTFTITNGSFTIPNVTVYNGWNNIAIYDTAWNYNVVSITTTNTLAKPQFVTITSPVGYDAAGTMLPIIGVNTVSGTITDPVGTSYAPSIVRADVYNYTTGTWTSYSSDAYDQVAYGYQPLSYAAGNFSFSVDFGVAGDYVMVSVYANDDITWVGHGAQQEFNSPWGNYSYYYKAGSKASSAPRNQAVSSELMKLRQRSVNRNR